MPRRPRPEDAIGKTRIAFADGMRAGDAAAAGAVYAEGATLLAPSAELIQGRGAIEAFWNAGVAAGVSDVELEAAEVARHDGLAYEIGRYALRLELPTGETVVDRGKYVLIHERQSDGSWKRAVEMFNPDEPPAHSRRHPKSATP